MRTVRMKTVLGMMAVLISATLVTGCASWWSQDKDSIARSEHMRMLEMQKSSEAARAAMDTPKELPELDARGLEQLGDNYVRQGNVAMAFVQYEKALAKDPNLESAKVRKGYLFLSRGMDDDALRLFDDVLSREPKNALALEGRGRVRMAKNDPEAAMSDFDKALVSDPRLWQVYALRGLIFDRRKDYDRAIGDYEKAIGIKSDSSLLYNNLGMAYFLRGDNKKAADTYAQAIKLDINNRRAYNNLGLVLFKMGYYSEALLAFKQGGDAAGAYNNMGCLYLAEKKYDKAIEAFEKAIALKPQYYAKAQENISRAKAGLQTAPAQ
jgi:tetratricopeptide (TPR) repeat protein